MVSGYTIRRSFRQLQLAVLLLTVVVGAAAAYGSGLFLRMQAERQLQVRAAETLAVQTEALTGILDKYRLLPPLLAREKSVIALFEGAGDAAEAKRKAIEISGMSGAEDVAFMRPDGSVLASADYNFPISHAQQRALLDASAQGRLGRQALITGDGRRVYAFAFGVRQGSRLLGHVAVYVNFDAVEATWSLSPDPVYVIDRSGAVFLSNRPEWRLQPFSSIASVNGQSLQYRDGDGVLTGSDLSRHLPLLDWQLHVLTDRRPLFSASVVGGVIAGLVVLLIGAGMFALVQWREAQILRMRRDRSTALKLERLVRERTRALRETNLSLSQEIDERRQAEERLRKAQAELVQAGKLAALGQMSAALSHEFNQPLAAIRTYSDNAVRLLEKDRIDSVRDNLGRITGLVDRMAGLSRSLLSFSRKPGTSVKPVALAPIVDEALMLTKPRANKAGVVIEWDAPDDMPQVLGGRIRLSQVFVNLINNAVDAIGDRGHGRVVVSFSSDDEGNVAACVDDDGPGVSDEIADSVFEPFFTTKGVGSGIGIGLSIASGIVRDFGGRIALEKSELGGARFVVWLQSVDSHREAAE